MRQRAVCLLTHFTFDVAYHMADSTRIPGGLGDGLTEHERSVVFHWERGHEDRESGALP